MSRNWCRLAALALGFGLVACHPHTAKAPAAPAPPPPPALKLSPTAETALTALYAESRAPGMVASIVAGDAAAVRGFGHVSPTDRRVPDGATLVRLDSVSKLFASELLAKLVAAHKLALTDPLTRFAPSGWAAPPPTVGDTPITLVELATHTSGLPRVFPLGAPTSPPSADQAFAERWAWLGKRRDARDPGKGAHYSNLGFDFLGDADAAAAGASYGGALQQLVTGPLGMADTSAAPPPDACARMMAADPGWNPPPCGDTSYMAASGGLYSTANDMSRWMLSQLAAGPADPVRQISQKIYVQRGNLAYASGVDVAGPANGIGLAWIELAPDGGHPRLLEKTGGGYGFMTYVVLDPAHRIGVFFAMNRMSGMALKLGAEKANDLVATLAGFNPALASPDPANAATAATPKQPPPSHRSRVKKRHFKN